MKIKSLLLGSAAAMMTVSGVATANAADAVFAAEPEPMEYVKVCDTYGNGYFYIPGTETCLRFSGFVRSEFIYTDVPDTAVAASFALDPATGLVVATPASVTSGQTTDWRSRARLAIDAQNETDWGTLHSQMRIEGDNRGGASSTVSLIRALVSLGGLRFGYTDTYQTTHHGYGWQLFANDGPYGFARANILDYTFAANGFSATIGVQDATSTGAVATGADVYDPYAGARYAGSWGNIAGSALYDSSADELAWKVSAAITAIENLSIAGWYHSDNSGTAYVSSATGDYAWGVSAAYTVNSQFRVALAYSDTDDTDADRFGIAAHWNPISGLSIRPEAVFGDNFTQVRLRVVRSF